MRVLILHSLFVALFVVAFASSPLRAQTQNDVDRVIVEGIQAFRKPGLIQDGAACANCHAPDGLDLAYIAFNEETLRRRAEPHVGNQLTEEDVDKIVALVDALRSKYNIDEPVDPLEFRPFQPGGDPLMPGASVLEKELAFYDQLVDMDFLLAKQAILTPEAARMMRDQMLSERADAKDIRVGIEMNRWSEDPHRGPLHATIADWLPDLPRLPVDADAWYALQDAYLADPTDARLIDMVEQVEDMTAQDFAGNGTELFDKKFRSVLLAQHFFRNEVAGQPATGAPFAERPELVLHPVGQAERGTYSSNPWWNIGDFMRKFANGNMELPEELFDRITPQGDRKETLEAEEVKLRMPWFWIGWTFDQSLQKSGASNSTKSAEYFGKFIRNDFDSEDNPAGFSLHALYMYTRKQIVQNYSPILLLGIQNEAVEERRIRVQYGNFAGYEWHLKNEPGDPVHRERYHLMWENNWRFWLFMTAEDIQQNGAPVEENDLEKYRDFVARARAGFEHFQTEHYTFNIELADAVDALLDGQQVNIPTATEEAEQPARFALEGNYPNPFNPSTTLSYSLGRTGPVHLAVYDLSGREVAVLVDRTQPAGRHEVTFDAGSLASGVYLSRLTAGGDVHLHKMVLIK